MKENECGFLGLVVHTFSKPLPTNRAILTCYLIPIIYDNERARNKQDIQYIATYRVAIVFIHYDGDEETARTLDKDRVCQCTWKEGHSWFTWYHNMGMKQQTTRHIASEEFISEELVRVRKIDQWDGMRYFPSPSLVTQRPIERWVYHQFHLEFLRQIWREYLRVFLHSPRRLLWQSYQCLLYHTAAAPHVSFFQQKLRDCGSRQEDPKPSGHCKRRPERRIEMRIFHDGK